MADIFTQGEVPVPPLAAKPEPGSGTADKKEPWTEQAERAGKKEHWTEQTETAEKKKHWIEQTETADKGDAGEDLTDLFSSLLKS